MTKTLAGKPKASAHFHFIRMGSPEQTIPIWLYPFRANPRLVRAEAARQRGVAGNHVDEDVRAPCAAQPLDHPFQKPARAAFHQQYGGGLWLPACQKVAHYSDYSGVLA